MALFFRGPPFNSQELKFGYIKCKMQMQPVSGSDLWSRELYMSGPKEKGHQHKNGS